MLALGRVRNSWTWGVRSGEAVRAHSGTLADRDMSEEPTWNGKKMEVSNGS